MDRNDGTPVMDPAQGHTIAQRVHQDADRGRMAGRNGYDATHATATVPAPALIHLRSDDGERTEPMIRYGKRTVSEILPSRLRNSPQLGEVLPLLYLSGMPTGAYGPALEQLLGADVGLAPAMITGLIRHWQNDARAFQARSLTDVDYVYVWVDEIYPKIRLEQDDTCLLVMIGVRSDGRKELITVAAGFGESPESWSGLLQDCRRRGMTAPMLAVGTGPLGFWEAARDLFPETQEQRCWCHQSARVLAALPKSAQPGAVKAMQDIYNAEDQRNAVTAAESFASRYETKWPTAVATITDELDALLTFYAYPVEHWVHLRTTNPIESIFTTVRRRQRIIEEPGSGQVGIAMAYKLVDSAQFRWRVINAPHLTPLLRTASQNRTLVGCSNNQDQQRSDRRSHGGFGARHD